MKKIGSILVVLLTLAAGLFMAGRLWAGSLDAPAVPDSTNSAMFTLEGIYQKLNSQGANVTKRTGGFTEPTGGPTNGTMHTLDDIMGLVTNRAPVPKTGVTATYNLGDDGTNRIGLAWPSPRFSTVGATGTAETNQIRDNLTGLIWARDANLASNTVWSVKGTCTWEQAFDVITNCVVPGPVNGANYGGTNDWRLPNVSEMYSLVDLGQYDPALPSGHPFVYVVASSYYWSSTTPARATTFAIYVDLHFACEGIAVKTGTQYVWPVRGP